MHNGQGALDWAGVPLVCALLGVQDIEPFMRNLMTIKLHRPPAEKDNKTPEDET